MRAKTVCAKVLAVTMLSGCLWAPAAVRAQRGRDHVRGQGRYSPWDQAADHRQQTKNEWRDIAIGAGAIGVLGALKHDKTLTFAGAAGALYSLSRYEQDRKSQSQTDRARAEYFSREYFIRDGQRYTRKTVNRGGQKYYQFVRE